MPLHQARGVPIPPSGLGVGGVVGASDEGVTDHRTTSGPRGRLLVVANRLPVTVALVKRPLSATTPHANVGALPGASAAATPIPDPGANAATPPTTASAEASPNPYLAAFAHAVAAQAQAAHHQQHHGPGHGHPGAASLHSTGATTRKDPFITEVVVSPSPGGLVSALCGVGMPMHWVGWPGLAGNVGRKERNLVRDRLRAENCSPVFLPPDLWDLYYNGFCNNTLWPLFHYIPLSVESLATAEEQFRAYEQANIAFAKMLLKVYRDGDIVWIHDYQLMLLPSLLRSVRPHMKIGFFLHTPFPSSEIYRVLPARKQLLLGVLSADVIGFHTHDYCRHFQSACSRILGATTSADAIRLNGLSATVGVFPIGIDPQRFLRALETQAVQHLVRELRTKFGNRQVLLGIDRLDYVKGILHKLYAYEMFFEQHPEWIGRVVLIQIAVPSRTDVPEYMKLRDKAHELVGKINGRFGNLLVVPVHYLDCSLSFEHMVSLYRIADATLITSIRDGMNLVASEYIACQQSRGGVLILSEFAGAAQSLGAGAIQVNPHSFQEIAGAIHQALCMPAHERMERNAYVFKHVITHTAEAWSRNFMASLNQAVRTNERSLPLAGGALAHSLSIIPPLLDQARLVGSFARARKRLVVLGLAGTLSNDQWFGHRGARGWSPHHSRQPTREQSPAPLTPSANNTLPTSPFSVRQTSTAAVFDDGPLSDSGSSSGVLHAPRSSFTPVMSAVLSILARDPHTTIVVLTSRSRFILDELLGQHAAIWLSAENGFFIRKAKRVQHVSGAGALGNVLHVDANAFAHHVSPQPPSPQQPLHTLVNALGQPLASIHSVAGASSDEAPIMAPIPSISPALPLNSSVVAHPWHVQYAHVDLSWKEGVARVFEYFTERTPHTFIADGETSMSWHFHDAEPVFARRQVNECMTHLTGGPLSNTATEVLDNSGVVQVRPLGVSKGTALSTILQLLARRTREDATARKKKQRASARKMVEEWSSTALLRHEDESDGEAYEESTFQRLSSPKRKKNLLTQRRPSLNASAEHGSLRSLAAAPATSIVGSAPAFGPVLSRASGSTSSTEGADFEATPIPSPAAPTLPQPPRRRSRSGSWSGPDRGNLHHLHSAHAHAQAQAQAQARYGGGGGEQSPDIDADADADGDGDAASAEQGADELIAAGEFDFVVAIGNFLERDEDVFTLLNPVMERRAATAAAAAAQGHVTPPSTTGPPSPHHSRLTPTTTSGIHSTHSHSASRSYSRSHSPTFSSAHSSKTSSPHFSFRQKHHHQQHAPQMHQDPLHLGGAAIPSTTGANRSPTGGVSLYTSELPAVPTGSPPRPHPVQTSRAVLGTRAIHPSLLQHAPTSSPDSASSGTGTGATPMLALDTPTPSISALASPIESATTTTVTALALGHGPSPGHAVSSLPVASWSSLNLHSVTPPPADRSNLFVHAPHVHDQLKEFQERQQSQQAEAAQAQASPDPSVSPASTLSLSALALSSPTLTSLPTHPTVVAPLVLTVAVGRKISKAKFHLPDRAAVEMLLTRLAQVAQQEQAQALAQAQAAEQEHFAHSHGDVFGSFHSHGGHSHSHPHPHPPQRPAPVGSSHHWHHHAHAHPPPLTPLLESLQARGSGDSAKDGGPPDAEASEVDQDAEG